MSSLRALFGRLETFVIGAPLLAVLVYVSVWSRYRIPREQWMRDAAADQAVRSLRAALDRAGAAGAKNAAAAAPGDKRTLPGPLWVKVFHRGEALFKKRYSGTFDAAIASAAHDMAAAPALRKLDAAARRAARIKIDLARAEGPIISGLPFFFAKSVVPGLDGLGLEAGGKHAYLLPDELYKAQVHAGYQPFYFAHEFRTGLDLRQVVGMLAGKLDLDRDRWRRVSKRWFRVRVESFLERPTGGGAGRLSRLRIPKKRITRAEVQAAIRRSADYVLRQQTKTGKFHYIYYPLHDQHDTSGEYNLPRHFGTTWFLALAYRHLRTDALRTGVQRAIDYLAAHAVPPSCRTTPYACVGNDKYTDLGSAALALVAISEYRVSTGDARFAKLADRLAKFIYFMRRGDTGDYCHEYLPKKRKKKCDQKLLYYTGEATLALAKHQLASKDTRYKEQIRRSMDFLTVGKYDYFLGKFFIGDDHWTCIAADFAHDCGVSSQTYVDFCRAFARLNRRAQVHTRSGTVADLNGAFTITPFFVPHNTPSGSRTEANFGTYLLTRKRGTPDPEVLDTVRRAVRYLVDQQIRPGSDYLYPNPRAASGGWTTTLVRAEIRIDFIQHAAAAMARALPFIPVEGWAPR